MGKPKVEMIKNGTMVTVIQHCTIVKATHLLQAPEKVYLPRHPSLLGDIQGITNYPAQENKRCGLEWDGRFDSMGHNAKYGAYTMFCSTVMKIVHFELLQVHFHANQSHFHLNGFTQGLVLKLR